MRNVNTCFTPLPGVCHGSEHFECEYSFVLTNEKPETRETASRNLK